MVKNTKYKYVFLYIFKTVWLKPGERRHQKFKGLHHLPPPPFIREKILIIVLNHYLTILLYGIVVTKDMKIKILHNLHGSILVSQTQRTKVIYVFKKCVHYFN